MKQEIIVSDTCASQFLTYIPSENRWKCTYRVYYEKARNLLESWSREIDVYFLKNEKVALNEENSTADEIEMFEQMKAIDSYKDHFENCWDVIEDIQNLRYSTPKEFEEFNYDFKDNYGAFQFEELLVKYVFLLEPGKGIKEIYGSYTGFNGYSEKVSLNQPPNVLFGEHVTNMLNEMIKKKLKLRYFF